MLSALGTKVLADWIEQYLSPQCLRRIIPEGHPVRWWCRSLDAGTADAETMVKVLVDGGHIPLLTAIVLVGRFETKVPPPRHVEIALAEALTNLDMQLMQATAKTVDSRHQDVFVCYAHEDSSRVDTICAALRENGLAVFRDTDSIPPGAGIAASIALTVSRTHSIVLIVSRASNGSEWVQREMSQVMARRLTGSVDVYPVVIEDVPLPLNVRDVFAIDLRNINEATDLAGVTRKLMRLIRTIKSKGKK